MAFPVYFRAENFVVEVIGVAVDLVQGGALIAKGCDIWAERYFSNLDRESLRELEPHQITAGVQYIQEATSRLEGAVLDVKDMIFAASAAYVVRTVVLNAVAVSKVIVLPSI